MVVENVTDFERWALFGLWREALVRLGYDVRVQVCDAAAWGVAQERRRVIVTAVRGGVAPAVVAPSVPGRTAGDVVDLSAGAWSPIARSGRAAVRAVMEAA